MKNIKQLLLTLVIVAITYVNNAQVNFRCDVQPTSSGPSFPTLPYGSCGYLLDKFIPNPSDANDTIDVNFVFFKPTTDTGLFFTVAPATLHALIAGLNNMFSNIGPPHIVTSPPAAIITDTKIRFKFKSSSLVTDNNAYIYPYWNGSHAALYPYIDSTAINIFFSEDTLKALGCGGGGHSFGGPGTQGIVSNAIAMGFCGSQKVGSAPEPIAHEIGHIFGLLHPHDPLATPIAPAYVPTPLDLDYPKEASVRDTARWCIPVNDSSSSNIMAYNWKCRSYLSPHQIATIHYLTQTFRTNSLLIKMPKPSLCNVNHTKDTTYNSNKVIITNKIFEGDVIINPGVELTVTCDVWMSANAKVIVKPGAKLLILGGAFRSICGGLWKGIEVWGDANQGQYVDVVTEMPLYQGMVKMLGGRISDAVYGITLGKRDSNDVFVTGLGGGIIEADSAEFVNNHIGVDFSPYSFVSRNPIYNENSSYFKKVNFDNRTGSSNITNTGYKTLLGKLPYAYVNMLSVQAIKFFGCQFNFNYAGVIPYGIKGIDASIKMQNYCTAITGSICTGVLTRNKFNTPGSGSQFKYGIHLSNFTNYMFSIIDNVDFLSSNAEGQIYLLNTNSTQITNCDFKVLTGLTINRYGIYSDNCTGYRIENNKFLGGPTHTKNVGIYVNNSGPYANSIYNNTFSTLEQGLWAQNHNVDWTTQVGLKMNCNDFTNCDYNIGVQKGGRYATLTPNNTGVDFTQGVAGLADSLNVRNSYSVHTCYTNAENKFYVNSLNTFSTSHGSFFGPQFHPTPQISASCSNSLELVDIVGNPPGGPKISYCPSVFTPTFSNLMLNTSATNQRKNIVSLTNSLTTLVDGGNTQSLLTAINSGTISDGNLKNMLSAVGPYLSDQVMNAYFNTNPPYGHDKIIHEINAPVSPSVYQKILSLNLPSGVMNAISNNQNQNGLSARRLLEAKLNLSRNELGLILNEKIRRFEADSTSNPVDSIAQIYQANEIANSELNLIRLLIAANRIEDAESLMFDLSERDNSQSNFINLQSIIIAIKKEPELAMEAINTPEIKSLLEDWAVSGDNSLEGSAKALLALIGEPIEEEKLSPEEGGSGARFSSTNEAEENQVIQLTSSVKIYPNPANNILYIEMENNNVNLIEIRDVLGKLVISQTIEYKGSINTQSLQNGIYFVNLVNESNLISSKKIVIIK
jgi:hypothetical protein